MCLFSFWIICCNLNVSRPSHSQLFIWLYVNSSVTCSTSYSWFISQSSDAFMLWWWSSSSSRSEILSSSQLDSSHRPYHSGYYHNYIRYSPLARIGSKRSPTESYAVKEVVYKDSMFLRNYMLHKFQPCKSHQVMSLEPEHVCFHLAQVTDL